MLVNLPGKRDLPSFKNCNLVISCSAAGHAPFMASDLMILNEPTIKKVAYYKSRYLEPVLCNDGLRINELKEELSKKGRDQSDS